MKKILTINTIMLSAVLCSLSRADTKIVIPAGSVIQQSVSYENYGCSTGGTRTSYTSVINVNYYFANPASGQNCIYSDSTNKYTNTFGSVILIFYTKYLPKPDKIYINTSTGTGPSFVPIRIRKNQPMDCWSNTMSSTSFDSNSLKTFCANTGNTYPNSYQGNLPTIAPSNFIPGGAEISGYFTDWDDEVWIRLFPVNTTYNSGYFVPQGLWKIESSGSSNYEQYSKLKTNYNRSMPFSIELVYNKPDNILSINQDGSYTKVIPSTSIEYTNWQSPNYVTAYGTLLPYLYSNSNHSIPFGISRYSSTVFNLYATTINSNFDLTSVNETIQSAILYIPIARIYQIPLLQTSSSQNAIWIFQGYNITCRVTSLPSSAPSNPSCVFAGGLPGNQWLNPNYAPGADSIADGYRIGYIPIVLNPSVIQTGTINQFSIIPNYITSNSNQAKYLTLYNRLMESADQYDQTVQALNQVPLLIITSRPKAKKRIVINSNQ